MERRYSSSEQSALATFSPCGAKISCASLLILFPRETRFAWIKSDEEGRPPSSEQSPLTAFSFCGTKNCVSLPCFSSFHAKLVSRG